MLGKSTLMKVLSGACRADAGGAQNGSEGHFEGEVGGTSGVSVTQEAIMALATGVQL